MTRRDWLRIPAVLLVPALGALTPLPRGMLLSVSAQAETMCRAIGACDTSASCGGPCGPAACTPCVPVSGGARLGCIPACEPSPAGCGEVAAVPDDACADTAPGGPPVPRGIVCICLQCGQGVPATSPEVAPPALAATLSETPPGVLASVSHEPASPPPKAPPIVT